MTANNLAFISLSSSPCILRSHHLTSVSPLLPNPLSGAPLLHVSGSIISVWRTSWSGMCATSLLPLPIGTCRRCCWLLSLKHWPWLNPEVSACERMSIITSLWNEWNVVILILVEQSCKVSGLVMVSFKIFECKCRYNGWVLVLIPKWFFRYWGT